MNKLNNKYCLGGAILLIFGISIWKISQLSHSIDADFDSKVDILLKELFYMDVDADFDSKVDILLKELKIIKRMQTSCDGLIGKRLEAANENWERGLKARKLLESKKLIDSVDPWNYRGGISIWDFFYANFDCPHTVERIGKYADGGKWICGLSHLARKEEACIVYSYGVSYETTFEDEVLARTNCSVYLFDHTINIEKIKLPKLYPGRAYVEKVGLGVKGGDKNNLRSISSTMKKYGHNFVDILKIDAEGAEFKVFDNFKNEFPNDLPLGQLSMEIHLNVAVTPTFVEFYMSWLTNLEDMGLRAFRNEVNLPYAFGPGSPHRPYL